MAKSKLTEKVRNQIARVMREPNALEGATHYRQHVALLLEEIERQAGEIETLKWAILTKQESEQPMTEPTAPAEPERKQVEAIAVAGRLRNVERKPLNRATHEITIKIVTAGMTQAAIERLKSKLSSRIVLTVTERETTADDLALIVEETDQQERATAKANGAKARPRPKRRGTKRPAARV